jgi:RNA polymerase sigma-70 factor (ECF subfamily)
VAAETFLIAWRRLQEVPDEPAAWLFGVARKVVAGQLRTDARQGAVKDRLAGFSSRLDEPADPADQTAERDSARHALARLGEQDQEVLMMAAWDGFPADIAADVLGISKAAYLTRLHRARQRLAAELADQQTTDPSFAALHEPHSAISRLPIPQTGKAR